MCRTTGCCATPANAILRRNTTTAVASFPASLGRPNGIVPLTQTNLPEEDSGLSGEPLLVSSFTVREQLNNSNLGVADRSEFVDIAEVHWQDDGPR